MHAALAGITFRSQNVKSAVRTTFRRSTVIFCGRRDGFRTSSKVSQTCGFCSNFKHDCRHGTFEDDLQRCISRDRRGTRDILYPSNMLRGQGADFLRSVAFWSIRWPGFLRWFGVKGAALCATWPQIFVASAIL